MENDKNCIPKSLGMFRPAKLSHMGPVFNFLCSGGARSRKVVKIWPKHFLTILMENY